MKKLYEITGHPRLKGDVGIEIEVEGNKLTDHVDPRWVATQDGSLRGDNREYVLRAPVPVKEARDALTSLVQNLKDAGSKPVFSFRTSVHVHVNVQELTYNQYLSMIYTYFLLEEPLMTYCGKERKGNRFCLRMQDAEGMVEVIQKMFRNSYADGLYEIPRDQIRYSALNIEATQKFGSLEFRGMRGNLDVELIGSWCDILVSIREFAKTVENPMDVYALYTKEEAQGFMEHVLGKRAATLYYPKVVKDVQRSFSLSLDLPHAFAASMKKLAPKAPAISKAELAKFALPEGWNNVAVAGILNPAAEIDLGAVRPRAAAIKPVNPYRNHGDEHLEDLREQYRVAQVKMPQELVDELEKREL